MIKVKLREAMRSYHQRTGTRVTYNSLAKTTAISVDTLQSLAARPGYNTRLSTIEKLCIALQCTPGDLLDLSTKRRLGMQIDVATAKAIIRAEAAALDTEGIRPRVGGRELRSCHSSLSAPAHTSRSSASR